MLSPRNPRIKELRRLAGRRSSRAAAGRYLIEGPVLVADAIAAGVDVLEVFVEAGVVRELVDSVVDHDIVVHQLESGTLGRVVETVTPQGIIAVAALPDLSVDGALRRAVTPDGTRNTNRQAPFVLVLIEVRDPGNAGTLLRTAEAAGAGAVLMVDSVEVTSPKTVRSSAGSLFRLPIGVADDSDALLRSLASAGIPTIGTVLENAPAYYDVDLSGPLALVVGNEAHGLGPDLVERLDQLVTIPMEGQTESLNVAMAGTIVAFELLRQRRSERP